MSSKDQAKTILAAMEPLQLTLRAADEAWAEIDAIGNVLTARKDELVEVEGWLSRTRTAAEEATARLDELSATSAKEEARISARIDQLRPR